jgi:hypothetical protein
MTHSSDSVDYLIVGAGATGMAFADTLLTETEATLAIADRHDRPGGHWNDAYPFVRLHQPSFFYGVNSRPLGSGAVDAVGSNRGLSELASGAEILAYFDAVMRQRFLPSGRVRYFPMTDVEDDETLVSRLSGERHRIDAGKVVNAAYLSPAVPATTPPAFAVAPGVTCVPVGDLPRAARPGASYVVIGAGKTGIDACLWLLDNGTDPRQIRWIMPRDSWLYDRAAFQPGRENLGSLIEFMANQVEALAGAESVDDVFARLEAKGAVLRLDPAVQPTMHHCAIVSRAELASLRRIEQIVRLGRVRRIESGGIVLEEGEIPTDAHTVHVNCSACAFAYADKPPRPIFADRRITLQWTRNCSPTFSAAFIAHVEAAYVSDEEKNDICTVIPTPTDAAGWLRIMAADLPKILQWSTKPELMAWLARSRLDITAGLATLAETDVRERAELDRYRRNIEPALGALKKLLAAADASRAA